jgi:multidrug resistance efflux pump
MTVTEVSPKRGKAADDHGPSRSAEAVSREPARLKSPRGRTIPFLLTLATVALAGVLCWRMWEAYMGTPWTRDATVRAYVVTMAPEVAGRIVEMPVGDNKYVRKGEPLLVIDPTNYTIAVSQAEAAVQQAQASVQIIDAQIAVQQAQVSANQSQLELAKAALVFAQQQAARYQTLSQKGAGTVEQAQQFDSQLHQQEASVQTATENLNLAQRQVEAQKAQRLSAEATLAQAKAQLHQAQVNLERTRIVSPVDGYVTNLQAQLGDYVNVGLNTISLVDADSFWIDGYFEETALRSIKEGQPVKAWLLGYREVLQGHVESVARGIVVANAAPGNGGLASVNPIFTWVRLAQRVPVRVQIDHVPADVRLVIGMTATVEVEPAAE